MSDIPPIQSAGATASFPPQRVGTGQPSVSADSAGDQLEISETGQLLSSFGSDSGIRGDKVAEIRQALANGTYETPEKLDVTVTRLLDVLRSMNVTA